MGLNNENAVVVPFQKPSLVFDIETCPSPDCVEYLTDPIEAPSNYKDPVKIADYIAKARQRQIDDAALDLDLCEVVAIGELMPGDGVGAVTRKDASEAEMIDHFWRLAQNRTLIGFNVLHFDLLVLLRRSLYLGVTPLPISVDRYRHDNVIDLADLLSFGRRDLLRSLSFYAKRLGILHDDSVKGADIPKLVAEGNWEAVRGHVKADVMTTCVIAERLKVLQPQPTPEAVAV